MPLRTKPQPVDALRLLSAALGGRVLIPLSWIRDRLEPLSKKVALEIEADGPGLHIHGEAEALGAPITFAARIDADGVHVEGMKRTLRIRLSEVALTTTDDAPGPLADAIRTGMIDTKNPATLIGNMVSLPEMIVSAEGQDLVIDLMKIPAIARDERLQAAVAAASSYLGITAIRMADDSLELRLGLLPGGAKEAALSTARAALAPALRILWPEGLKR
jgi:hypothetical protein